MKKIFLKLLSYVPWVKNHRARIVPVIILLAHLLGALTSIKAIMDTRTSQGAIAWAVSLNACPYVAVPAYWIFGSRSFNGYVKARRSEAAVTNPIGARIRSDLIKGDFLITPAQSDRSVVEKIAQFPLTRYNHAELLIDGKATFDSILAEIEAANQYILFQFYILRSDNLGNRLKAALIEKAKEGVKVYALYDEIGSTDLSSEYIEELTAAGVAIHPFNTRQGRRNRFQINFRNHRKIVVVDGRSAFIGGHNVGDEYLGKSEKFGKWRDTHVKIVGPSVLGAQVSFIEDWNWATGEIPELHWVPHRAPEGNLEILCLPTGPADETETCALFFHHSINSAKKRVWIASPYFVPDQQIMSALQLAALRGVDVRILLPNEPDQLLVYLSSFSFLPETEQAGIKILRYTDGFLHEKAMLIDDDISAIGTANFDNRSFRLNFEITCLIEDTTFATKVEKMFQNDFAKSREIKASELTDRSFGFRFAVKVARLLDPIQ